MRYLANPRLFRLLILSKQCNLARLEEMFCLNTFRSTICLLNVWYYNPKLLLREYRVMFMKVCTTLYVKLTLSCHIPHGLYNV